MQQYPSAKPIDIVLSNQWRLSGSRSKDLELANVLKSTRTMVDFVYKGGEKVTVGYGTQSKTTGKEDKEYTVTLDAGVIMGQYPVPGEKLDPFCGHTLHEVLHIETKGLTALAAGMPEYHLTATRKNRNRRARVLGRRITPTVQQELNKFLMSCWRQLLTIGEEVVVDNARPGIISDYIKKARQQQVEEHPTKEVNWENLWDTWMCLSVFNIMPDMQKIPQKVLEPLQHLLSLANSLRPTGNKHEDKRLMIPGSRVNRMYTRTWTAIWRQMALDWLEHNKEYIRPPKRKNANKGTVVYDPFQGIRKDCNKCGQEHTTDVCESQVKAPPHLSTGDEKILHHQTSTPYPLTSEEMEQIEEIIETGVKDMQPEIQGSIDEVLGKTSTGVITENAITVSLAKTDPIVRVDEKMVENLSWIRNLQLNQGFTVYRQEEDGLIDELNLDRFLIDGRIFRQKIKKPRKDLKILLLMDASGSMSSKTKVYEIAYALGHIWRQLPIFSYTHSGRYLTGLDGVSVINHNADVLREIRPGGDTPSSEGLLTVAHMYPDYTCIHFTDGYPSPQSKYAPYWSYEKHFKKIFHILNEKFPAFRVLNICYNPDGMYNNMLSPSAKIAETYYQNDYPNNDLIHIQDIQEFAKISQDLITDRIIQLGDE